MPRTRAPEESEMKSKPKPAPKKKAFPGAAPPFKKGNKRGGKK